MPHSPASRSPFILFAVLVAVIAHATSGLPLQVRFSYAPLNYWLAAALAVSLPAMLLWVTVCMQRRFFRALGVVSCVAVALPSLAFAGLALLEGAQIKNNVDTSFELLSEGRFGFSSYRLYRTSCGATCAFGLVLRKEYESPFGVKLVTPVWSLYRASEGSVQVEGATVRVVSGVNILATIKR